MRHYYVEVRKPRSGQRELIRARGRRDARKLLGTIDQRQYRARIIELRAQ